jgi:hypothetical protein
VKTRWLVGVLAALPTRVVNFPNFASSTDTVSVNLNDFEYTAAPWSHKRRR